MIGVESEALQRIKKFAAECQNHPNKGSSSENIYGTSFTCKIAPWLSNGCISPRTIFDELKNTASNAISATIKPNDGGDGGSNWLMYELMWRDFFRFVTKKCGFPGWCRSYRLSLHRKLIISLGRDDYVFKNDLPGCLICDIPVSIASLVV